MAAAKENKYAVGNNGGRPPAYKSSKELHQAIDSYFEYIKGEFHIEKKRKKKQDTNGFYTVDVQIWDRYPEPATVTGLTLFLGFGSRSSLDDYEKRNKEFSYIIKKGRSRVEHEYEKNLHSDRNVGSIFALKNMGWRDKIETGQTDNAGNDIPPLNDTQVDRIISALRQK